MGEFSKESKRYLTRVKIDEKEVAEKNSVALELIMKAEWEKKKLTSFVFNKKMIVFMKNEKAAEMGNIGFVKYKGIEFYSLEYDFKKIDIKDVVNGGTRVQVYPLDDGTFSLLHINSSNNGLIAVRIDKDKKIVSPAKSYNIVMVTVVIVSRSTKIIFLLTIIAITMEIIR